MRDLILAEELKRRKDDELQDALDELRYERMMARFCKEVGCNKGELFTVLDAALERQRRQKRGKTAIIVGAITAGVGGVVALAFDWVKRAP